MPEFHLIDLQEKPGAAGFYFHHPMDYGLPEVKDDKGKVIHAADNNHWVHSLTFGKLPGTIEWNYGPMTSVGEPLGWTLDITHGLDGTPTHGPVGAGSGNNKWGQYESHGQMIGTSTYGLYFSGPPQGADGKTLPGKWGWGAYVRDFARDDALPRFIFTCPGGHIAGGNSLNPDIWAAYVSASWRKNVKESDAIVWGHLQGPASVLCYTFSDVRGGIKREHGKPVAWGGVDNPAYRPYSSIPRPLLSPDGTKVWFHSSMLMPTEDYAGIYVAVVTPPQAPVNLRLAGDSRNVLQWDAAPMHHETRGYHVYRGDADGANFTELTTAAIPETQFKDTTAEADRAYTYAVTAEEWSTLESAQTSNLLKVAPGGAATVLPGILQWDKTAPPPVGGLQARHEADADGQYRLMWSADGANDLRHYNIYFSAKQRPDISSKNLLVSPPRSATEYLDWSAPGDSDAYYAITAVDRAGNESAPTYVELHR
jgi:hypothetical protein